MASESGEDAVGELGPVFFRPFRNAPGEEKFIELVIVHKVEVLHGCVGRWRGIVSKDGRVNSSID